MNILFIRDNPKEYIAKMYWALQKGLRKACNLVTFGKGQDLYDSSITRHSQILAILPKKPDLIITDFRCISHKFRYDPDTDIPLSFIMGDYWRAPTDADYGMFKHIFCLFYNAVRHDPKFLFTPPCVDTDMFKDWRQQKKYDVGFLGSGCTERKPNYPERYLITQKLRGVLKERFFTADHPGWVPSTDHPLVGENFSKAINRCRMFVCTAGITGHCNPKYYEIAASGSLLLAQRCSHMEKSGFEHGVNCLIFDTDEELLTLIRTIDETNRHRIISSALKLIQERHTGETRAKELLKTIQRHHIND